MMIKEEELFESSDELLPFEEDRNEPESDLPSPSIAAFEDSSDGEIKADNRTPREEDRAIPPTKPQEKKGILGRIFQKPGGGRPTSLEDALTATGAGDYHRLVARALLKFAPEQCLSSLELTPLEHSADAQELISSARESLQLSKEEGAESFAGIASALMVGFVDHVVELSETKKMEKDEVEKSVVDALDQVATFINATGELFGKLYAGITIEPVVYNGKSKRGKLENIYYIYSKASMNIASILSGATGEDDKLSGRVDNLGKVNLLSLRLEIRA